ncbi:MAG: universal stress protein [Methanobacteriaceae archaeon]|nr:universal stress protein [Methanobacteriaceae archaeon]MDP2837591.1 universal stress protein [Methanobacteriaceae archaeon]MDP3035986.1 universal stress protein [Methanobacteriaceae archaeon]MDP3485729.1 universal stress protein [Methanobacteriaceae archaeon]MDP3624324.1 universal stress protein [Methanobacteriaceae archaeon]
MYKKILLPTDGSEHAKKAGEHAIMIANAGLAGLAGLVVLSVVDAGYLDALTEEDLKQKLDNSLKKEGKEAVENFSAQLMESKCHGVCQQNVKLTTEIKEGNPADVILKTIEEDDIDLVVIGSSGKHALTKFVYGSVTDKVVRSAKCPVLVIK